MPGTEANLGVDIPVTIDQRLDARRVTQTASGFAVDREAIVLADPVATDEIARVTSAEGLDVDVTRVSGTVTVDPTDKPLRDNGKIDIALFDSALPAGSNNIGVVNARVRNLADGAYIDPATLGEQQTQTTSLQLSDDVVHALNAAFGKATAIAGQLDDTTPTAATEDNIAPVRITAQRAQHVNLRNNAGTELGTGSAPVRTDPTGSTTQPVSQGTAASAAGAWPVLITNTADTAVKPGDATNNAVRVNIVAGAAAGGTSQTDKSTFTEGTTAFTPVGGTFNETISADPTEDQAAAARITAKRALHVNLRDAAGNEVSPGGGTQYDEDTPAGDGAAEKLTMAGVVRKDAAVSMVNLDGDRTELEVDGSGRLWVNASAVAVPVTDNAGSLTVDNPILSVVGGGTEAAAQRVTIANDSTGVLSVDDNGGLLSVDDGAGSLTIDGTVTANAGTGVFDITPSAPVATDYLPTRLTDGTNFVPAGGGTQATALRVTVANDSTGLITIQDGGNVISVDDAAGSLTVDGTVTANQGTSAGTAWEMIGDVAHDAVAPANPVITGGQMETMDDTAPGTRASTDGDAMKAAVADGAMFVIPSGPQIWSYHEDSSSALTDATVHAAPGAGLSLYVTTIVCSIGAATAWNVFFEAPNLTTVLGPWYLEAVAGRGVNIYFATPKKITANTALTVTTSAAIAHSIDITGFISPG